MSIALENRQERHLMRQRGAGARTITANFGFVFQAGPVQLQTSSDIHKSVPAQQHNPSRQVDSSASKTEAVNRDPVEVTDAPRKEKIVGAVKRTNLDQDQKVEEQADEHIPDGDAEVTPVEAKPGSKKTKRKPASKRFTAPKSRQKRQANEGSHTHTTNPEPQSNEENPQSPAPKRLQEQKAEEKLKTVATSTKPNAPRSKRNLPVENGDEDDELSNDSIPSIITSKSISKKRTADCTNIEALFEDTLAARKKTKAASQKITVNEELAKDDVPIPRKKKAATRTRESRPAKDTPQDVVQEERSPEAPKSLFPHAEVDAPESIEIPQEDPQNLEPTKRNKRTAATTTVKTGRKRRIEVEDDLLPKDNLNPTKATTKRQRGKVTRDYVADQAVPIQSDDEINRGSEEVIAEPKKSIKARQTKRTHATQDDNQPKTRNIEVEEHIASTSKATTNLTRSKKTKPSEPAIPNPNQAIPEEENRDPEMPKKRESTSQKATTGSKRTRRPLSSRDSNESSQKVVIDLEEPPSLKTSKPRTKSVAIKRGRNTEADQKPVVHNVSPHRTSTSSTPIGLGITIPENTTVQSTASQFESKHDSKHDIDHKFTAALTGSRHETKQRGTKKRKSIHVHEDLDGFFDETPVFAQTKGTLREGKVTVGKGIGKSMTGKTTSGKRIFRDEDEDVDLDDLLDGIAVIAGAGGVKNDFERRRVVGG